MNVEYGNPAPNFVDHDGPAVTYQTIPDSYTYRVAADAAELASGIALNMATAPDGITNLPDQEAALAAIAGWRANSRANPTWVWSDNEDFAVLLGKFFGCPVGRPVDVEETHYTVAGAPGVGPEVPE